MAIPGVGEASKSFRKACNAHGCAERPGGGNISLFALLRLFAAANVKYTKLARVNVKSATQCNIHLQDIFGIFQLQQLDTDVIQSKPGVKSVSFAKDS